MHAQTFVCLKLISKKYQTEKEKNTSKKVYYAAMKMAKASLLRSSNNLNLDKVANTCRL